MPSQRKPRLIADPTDYAYSERPGGALVGWDPRSNATYSEWQGWADSTEFAAASEAALTAMKEHDGSCFLGDCRDLKAIEQSDEEGVDRDWVLRALSAGLRKMALVIPKSAVAHTNLEQMMSGSPRSGVEVGYFTTVEDATVWLNQTRPPATGRGPTSQF